MSALEDAGIAAAVAVAIMTVYNRIVIRRRKNIAERIAADREIQDMLNESELKRAKSSRCKLCGQRTFPSALKGFCVDCWKSGRALGDH